MSRKLLVIIMAAVIISGIAVFVVMSEDELGIGIDFGFGYRSGNCYRYYS